MRHNDNKGPIYGLSAYGLIALVVLILFGWLLMLFPNSKLADSILVIVIIIGLIDLLFLACYPLYRKIKYKDKLVYITAPISDDAKVVRSPYGQILLSLVAIFITIAVLFFLVVFILSIT